MSKSFKFKNNYYLDSSSIVDGHEKLSDILNSNWTNLTLLNNFTEYAAQNVPQYRKLGKCVFLRGLIKTTQNITSSNRTIATLPFTTNQYTNTYYPCVMVSGSTKTVEQIQFSKTGNLLAPATMTTSHWIALDGIVIILD